MCAEITAKVVFSIGLMIDNKLKEKCSCDRLLKQRYSEWVYLNYTASITGIP